jgi:DNA-binding NarL/FixJ family response regulator
VQGKNGRNPEEDIRMTPACGTPAVTNNGFISVTLVDDHIAVWQGLSVLLERRGFSVLASAGSVSEARAALAESMPDVLVVDLCLPDGCGAALIRELRATHPGLKAVVFTGSDDRAVVTDALHCGAQGFAAKAGGIDELIQALRAVHRGQRYIDPRFEALNPTPATGGRTALTPRESQILRLLADGLTACEVADQLVLSRETVKTHVRNAMRRLQAKTRAQAVAMALLHSEGGAIPDSGDRLTQVV